jgi:hypothetical protein
VEWWLGGGELAGLHTFFTAGTVEGSAFRFLLFSPSLPGFRRPSASAMAAEEVISAFDFPFEVPLPFVDSGSPVDTVSSVTYASSSQ